MTDKQLGRIEEVDLREVWPNEAGDFTPWLAENLDRLSRALHLDLTLIEAEGAVGAFAVDIVAESGSGLVVIENQLERTDHTHLGQLLTYAAGRDARILIWITPAFREEHRAALDWLNSWAPEEIQMYGVEVRAIRIDDSRPAPEFRPVAFPNTWSRQTRARRASSSISTEEGRRRNAFMQALLDDARERGLTNVTSTSATHNLHIPSDLNRWGIRYYVNLFSNGEVLVGLEIATGDRTANGRILESLLERRAELEDLLGFTLESVGLNGRSTAWVGSRASDWTDASDSRQAAVRQWAVDTLAALMAGLNPRLREIVEELDAE